MNVPIAPTDDRRYVVCLAVVCTIEVFGFATLDPFDLRAGQKISIADAAWIAAQASVLMLPAIGSVFLFGRGASFCLMVPLSMLLDAFAWRWMGDHFLSVASWRIVTELRAGLAAHLTANVTAGFASLAIVGLAISWMACWISRKIAAQWSDRQVPTPLMAISGWLLVTALLAAPALLAPKRVRTAMSSQPFQHPFCVARWIDFRSTADGRSPLNTNSTMHDHESAILARDRRQRVLFVDRVPDTPYDVLIVVVESLRRELVTAEVMPNLWRYAERGILAREHFSGGNATTHGMFSLVNGLEAIWYERAVRYSPILNRLFRHAGYKLGFFAGHDDWRTFRMDGFISEEQFDVYETGNPNGLVSDRKATQRAAAFLDRGRHGIRFTDEQASQRPRLAILYLYATHSTYNSYVEDQVFQPAADDRFLIPYTRVSRGAIWNRYKNAAHTVDRFLDAVMREDLVIVVTGDHGESFLDDGTIGHGTKISEFQNMSAAVVYIPGDKPRVIDSPTMHADLLPTILSAVGIGISDAAVLDGIDLRADSLELLNSRSLVTRNYLKDDVALIGPWTGSPDQPFAYRGSLSLSDLRATATGAIDRTGESIQGGDSSIWEAWIESRLK